MTRTANGQFQLTRRTLAGSGCAALIAPGACAPPPEEKSVFNPVAGRTLVFEDAFAEFDHSVWRFGPKAGTADPGFWGRSAFARFGGDAGFDPYAIVDDERAENGRALQLSAGYVGRNLRIPNYYGNEDPEWQWVSGNLQTAEPDGTVIRGWRNGYFEARMLFPEHPLTWPAFWLLNGSRSPNPEKTVRSVEIDIVEHKGFEKSGYGAYLHEHDGEDEHHEDEGVETGVDLTSAYWRYGVLIDGATCIPYFERKPVLNLAPDLSNAWNIHRADQLDEAENVFWPLLTLAMRHDYPFPDPLRDEHKQAHMRIDYFRVYS